MKKNNIIIGLSSLALLGGLIGCVPKQSIDLTGDFDVETIFGRIGYNANKYRSEPLTKKDLYEATNISPNKTNESYEVQQVLALIKAGFSDVMPELDGYRTGAGIFNKRKIDEFHDWIDSYGLWGNKSYNPNEVATMELVNKLLSRIHTYMGTSLKDDYATFINKDLIDSLGGSSSYYESSLIDGRIVSSKVTQIIRDAANNNAKSSAYALFDNFYDIGLNSNTITLEGESDDYVNNFISEIKTISSCEEFMTHERNAFLTKGRNSVLFTPISTMEMGYNNDYQIVPYLKGIAGFDVEEFARNVATYNPEGYVSKLNIAKYKNIGLSDSDAELLTDNLKKFYTALKEEINAIKEVSLPKMFMTTDGVDPFEGTTLSLQGMLRDAGYQAFDIKVARESHIVMKAINNMLKDSANLDGLKANCIYQFLANKGYQYDETLSTNYPGTFIPYDFYNLQVAGYYSTTDEYAYAVQSTKELLSDYIVPAFKSNFVDNQWLSNESIASVNTKIDKMTSNLYWDLNGVDNLEFEKYFENVHYSTDYCRMSDELFKAKLDFSLKTILEKHLGYSEIYYFMSDPLTQNAYYFPNANSINIYFGFLLSRDEFSSFKDESGKIDIQNMLGQYGVVLGHEISHGFDSSGIYFDGDGNYLRSPIITSADSSKYKTLQNKVTKAYSKEEVFPGVETKGSTVLGEAIADIGGVNVCLSAIKNHEEGVTDFSKFFESFGSHFMTAIDYASYKSSGYANDVHPVGKARINGVLKYNKDFQKTYNIQPGDGMYVPLSDCIVIW